MIKRALVALVALAVHWTAAAQSPEPLFIERSSSAANVADVAPAASAVIEQLVVGMRIDRLFETSDGVATQILLNAGNHSWVARFERLDHDAAGFRSWVGSIDEVPQSHVVFTERDGIVSGIIDAVGITYQVRTRGPDSYFLERIETSALGDELPPLTGATADAVASQPADVVTAADDARTIDVLMLYTPNARNQRGGTAQIEALVSQIISDTNTAFVRSGITARVRLVGVAQFSLEEAPSMRTDLQSVRSSPEVRAGRDSRRADLVQLLVASPDQVACGYGYLLDSLSHTNFDAYSVADVACAAQYTPTHEMAHNMGSHHAPDDDSFPGLFPYSHGFKDPVRGFRSVMAYACSGRVVCDRILNFSNPSVTHRGGPTGTGVQDNARSINEASFTVANFRQSTVAAPEAVPAPADLRSTITGERVTLAWSPVARASSYLLQVGTRLGAVDVFSAPVGTNAVSGVVPAGNYFWRVYAQNDTGRSVASDESQFTVSSCTLPGPPRDFAFAVDACPHCAPAFAFVTLNWAPPATGSTPATYIVEAGSAPGLANLFNAATGPGLGFATPAPHGSYHVRIRAQNACGISAASADKLIVVQ